MPEWLLCLKRHWPEQRKTTHPEDWFCCIFSNPHRRILCTGFELGVVFKIMLQETAIFLRCTMHDPWASPLKRRWKCERIVYRSISERIMAFSPSAWVLSGVMNFSRFLAQIPSLCIFDFISPLKRCYNAILLFLRFLFFGKLLDKDDIASANSCSTMNPRSTREKGEKPKSTMSTHCTNVEWSLSARSASIGDHFINVWVVENLFHVICCVLDY